MHSNTTAQTSTADAISGSIPFPTSSAPGSMRGSAHRPTAARNPFPTGNAQNPSPTPRGPFRKVASKITSMASVVKKMSKVQIERTNKDEIGLFPFALGPFRVKHNVEIRLVLRKIKLPVRNGQQMETLCYQVTGPPELLESAKLFSLPIAGQLSPPMPIYVDKSDWRNKPGCTKYSHAYPVAGTDDIRAAQLRLHDLKRGQRLGIEITEFHPLRFLVFGGFVYFDEQQNVVQINAFTDGQHMCPFFDLGSPFPVPEQVMACLENEQRMQRVCDARKQHVMAETYAWLAPGEYSEHFAAQGLEERCGHGGFIYQFGVEKSLSNKQRRSTFNNSHQQSLQNMRRISTDFGKSQEITPVTAIASQYWFYPVRNANEEDPRTVLMMIALLHHKLDKFVDLVHQCIDSDASFDDSLIPALWHNNICQEDSQGLNTAVMVAIGKGYSGAVKALIEAARPHEQFMELVNWRNSSGQTALMLSALHGDKRAAALLLHANANVHTQNTHGENAITMAARVGVKDVVELLLQSGADPLRSSMDGSSAMTLARSAGWNELEEYMQPYTHRPTRMWLILRAHVTKAVEKSIQYKFDNTAFIVLIRNRANLARKCNEVIGELVSTEEKYIEALQRVCDFRQMADAVITPEESNKIFSCINEITSGNNRLCKNLFQLSSDGDGGVIKHISDAFGDFVKTTLHHYLKYCGNIVWATEQLNRLKSAKKSKFAQLHDKLKQRYGKGLDMLLVEPMQRITRYPLIFERLKYFLIEHDDRETLKQSLKQARRAVGQVNVDIEQYRRLYDLEKSLKRHPLLSYGLIQRQDTLTYASYKGKAVSVNKRDAKQVTAFVFKSAVVVTKTDRHGNYQWVSMIKLNANLIINDIAVNADGGSLHAWGITIWDGTHPEATHVFVSPSQQTKEAWMTMQDSSSIQLPSDQVTKGNLFGLGELCNVHEGKLSNIKSVAVKVPRQSDSATLHESPQLGAKKLEIAIHELEREAEMMQYLPTHSNFVRFYGLCDSPDLQSKWLVMELMVNGSLDVFLNGTTAQGYGLQVEFDGLVDIFVQVATGLAALHENNIVHRNLQASNILIGGGVDDASQPTVVKISSFRLAAVLVDHVRSITCLAFHGFYLPCGLAAAMFGICLIDECTPPSSPRSCGIVLFCVSVSCSNIYAIGVLMCLLCCLPHHACLCCFNQSPNYAAPNGVPDTELFWRAPETQKHGLYSFKTDVWAAGILFAEALLVQSPSSYGNVEIYDGLSDAQVMQILSRNGHMDTAPGTATGICALNAPSRNRTYPRAHRAAKLSYRTLRAVFSARLLAAVAAAHMPTSSLAVAVAVSGFAGLTMQESALWKVFEDRCWCGAGGPRSTALQLQEALAGLNGGPLQHDELYGAPVYGAPVYGNSNA